MSREGAAQEPGGGGSPGWGGEEGWGSKRGGGEGRNVGCGWERTGCCGLWGDSPISRFRTQDFPLSAWLGRGGGGTQALAFPRCRDGSGLGGHLPLRLVCRTEAATEGGSFLAAKGPSKALSGGPGPCLGRRGHWGPPRESTPFLSRTWQPWRGRGAVQVQGQKVAKP